MPLGKYYCDYCDKQFQDTPYARRKHLSGTQHNRARALWYDSFKDPHGRLLVQPDGSLAKGICHHFVRTGICKYGDTCKYFHPKPTAPPSSSISGFSSVDAAQSPNALGNQLMQGSSGNVVGDQTGISWGNLPPSLRLPPDGGYPPLPFVDWG